jgi:hypothetical protein
MAVKKPSASNDVKKKVDNRQKIIVSEGGKANSTIPYKVLHMEYVDSANTAKEREKVLREQFPDASVVWFSL